ncbi:FAD-binding oxidoreductase [Alginatibacterium sediminis]|uniref:D-lactate dehydrogenase (cytochrome) n=1 Tax=Alginatibacterium sediminis TaxID=2164068 RepID=A0A420ED42_9ALTE|nr:FAD-binding and (Fe-S)-binding domain-containing protein [Alginatibacterium sediminis]RKF18590.1 FAD-binding oxidoreductase [Alginatibacterium sediminis]
MTASAVTSSPYQALKVHLLQKLDLNQVIDDPNLCLAFGGDASFYRLVPQLVLRLNNISEVQWAIQSCQLFELACTFRAAGTSLSGQALSDSVLLTLSDAWNGHEIIDQGEKIVLQPGVIGSDANRFLKPYGKKIGPDPASINACKMGGIAANNASGMCCGTAHNTYHTLDSMKIVLHDGSLLDTKDSYSRQSFRQSHGHFLDQLETLARSTQANTELTQKIRHKYRLKNTTGYSLNALVDFSDGFDILQHLMVGSEGTLGFIAELCYRTVDEPKYKASALLVYPSIERACEVVAQLSKQDVNAVELMDGRSLRSVADKAGMPSFIKELDIEASALLVELSADSADLVEQKSLAVLAAIDINDCINEASFSLDSDYCAQLWAIRKGLFPAVGAVRDVGTTVIIEDVAFAVDDLANGVRDLQQLFDSYQYSEAIIFGHALAGNVHFVFTQGFDDAEQVQRYQNFMHDIAQLVAVKYQGSLKAEHGTGRNMAPYVELEWGSDAYQLMQQIKVLFDPKNLLNPGVIINSDPLAHVQNLKPMPKADPLVDRCIECGFCEAVCPSRRLSYTPRQRIVMYRHLQQLRRENGDLSQIKQLESSFKYHAIDTCAATGLCEDRCPVGINTGDLVKQLRQDHSKTSHVIAKWTADHFQGTAQSMRVGLSINHIAQRYLGEKPLKTLNTVVQKLSRERAPQWFAQIPRGSNFKAPTRQHHQRKVVYFASCASRNMGPQLNSRDERGLGDVIVNILTKAGFEIICPEQLGSQCCGMPYNSKGLVSEAKQKAAQLNAALVRASENGRWPILSDTSPCTKQALEFDLANLEILEPISFAQKYLLEHLELDPIDEPVMLHVTCTSKRLGLSEAMLDLAKQCASKVVVPEGIDCCGFAGDKGFLQAELNESALQDLKSQVPSSCSRGYSNSRTCEIGLSRHSGIEYHSLMYLLDEISKPRNAV